MIQRAVRFLHKEPTIWGPISLLFTLAVAVKTAIPFDLVFIAVSGLFLCSFWHMRGCCYSLVLLAVASIFKHAFVVTDHLWELGVEGSMACAFFIIALAFEQGASFIESLHSQMQTRKAALENLEEEIAKVQETAQGQQISFQEKVATLQKELEDLQVDHSSILILNEVLRKTTARHVTESEAVHVRNFELLRKMDILKAEYEDCETQLIRLKNTDAMAIENRKLLKELNAARYEKEQTHLINETLARLYARESLKAKDADSEAASLTDQLAAARKEAEQIAQPLEENLSAARSEIGMLKYEFEKNSMEANRAREQLLKLGEIQTEKNFLKERLQAAMEEIAHLQQKPREQLQSAEEKIAELQKEIASLQQNPIQVVEFKEDPLLMEKLQVAQQQIEELQNEITLIKQEPKMSEELAFAQEKVMHLSQIEPLFKQLKKQFEEKNQILHQVRSDLFKSDTELQRLRMEKEALELTPMPKEVEREVQDLGAQIMALEEENQQLQELITVLSDSPSAAPKQKKK
jgi:chromosome segregation ATPase